MTVRTYVLGGGVALSQLAGSKIYKGITVVYGYDASYYPGDSVIVKAKLLSGSVPISGRAISFAIPGDYGTATTDSNGYAQKLVVCVKFCKFFHGITGKLKQLATENGPTRSSSEVASCVFH